MRAQLYETRHEQTLITLLVDLEIGSVMRYSRVKTIVNIGSYTIPLTGTLSRSTNVVPRLLFLQTGYKAKVKHSHSEILLILQIETENCIQPQRWPESL